MLTVEERVDRLEDVLIQVLQNVDRNSREMRLSQERSEQGMVEFKQEIRKLINHSEQKMEDFKQEMRESRDRSEQKMEDFINHSERRMEEFINHSERRMEEFINHSDRKMEEFKQEMRNSKRNTDKQWGELTRKLGTMAEDLVAPGIPNILRKVTGCMEPLDYVAVRVKRGKPMEREFDVVAVCGEWVLINETKSTLRPEYILDFHELMPTVPKYFPEFAGKKFIGAIASLYVDKSLVTYGEKLGLIVLGFGEELMEVLNSPQFVPTAYS